jgi:hypothetical protein
MSQNVAVNSPLTSFARGTLFSGAVCAAFGAAASGISAAAGYFFPDISMAQNLGTGSVVSGFVGFMIFAELVISGCSGYYDEDGFCQVAHRDLSDHSRMLGAVASGITVSTAAFALAAYKIC